MIIYLNTQIIANKNPLIKKQVAQGQCNILKNELYSLK